MGASTDLSGPLASIGTALRDGYQTYFSQANAAGGIDGHKISLNALDDASDPTRGVANTKQLSQQDGVSAELVFLSNVIAASAPVLSATHTPAITQAGTPTLVNPPQPDIYLGDILIGDEPTPEFSFAKTLVHGSARAGVIAIATAAGASYTKQAVQLAKAAGWPIVATQQVELTSTTAAPQAQAVAAQHPSVIFMALTDPLAISAASALRQQGFRGPIVNYDGGSAVSTLQKLADPQFYVVRPFPYAGSGSPGPAFQQYVAAARTAGVDPNKPFLINGYVQAYVIGQALKRCGYPCPAQKMTEALQGLGSLNTRGLTFGPWVYSASNHAGIAAVKIFHWSASKDAPVATSSQLPIPSR